MSNPETKDVAPSRLANRFLSLNCFEPVARRRLPRPVFGYVSGGAEDNKSLQANRDAFDDVSLVPRVLTDVSRRSQSVTVFGQEFASPFGVAPMGLSALSAYRGDIVQARAARKANIPMILSGASLIPMEEVIAEAPGIWFQAYLPADDAGIDALIDRVRAAGFRTLVVTVDIPISANRENNVRNGFSTPLRPSARLAVDGITHPRWLVETLFRTVARHGLPHFENSFANRGVPVFSSTVLRNFAGRDHFSWRHIERIRQRWGGDLLIKGILSREDARIAEQAGVDGIVVSNHGGRQLDGAIAPLRVLPEIVDSVQVPVLIDSGFRRGSDVLKAIALGARLVFVGRPFNYAAAVAGEAGVAHAIRLLAAEVDRNLAMLGAHGCDELNRTHIRFLRASEPLAAR
ncbi:MAG: alpha-hydroxy acid oxidase [Pseudochelatococcus sp.]|jgi:L-lactate dehydrogenase (cytochrome)|uniref:alpha-hydroxy acid oxidase n=1 Tax=Pseudochelatococcus sp. TaxID=2020869 RepID=UPI003D8D7F68